MPQDILQIGVFWPGCGHRFILDDELIRMNHRNPGLIETCPICRKNITDLSDGVAVIQMQKEGKYNYPGFEDMDLFRMNDDKLNDVRLISFRQQKINYRIGVRTYDETAQKKIAHILGTTDSLVKILHKGKIIYPSPSSFDRNPSEASNFIIKTSNATKNRLISDKPNILVISTRSSDLKDDFQAPKYHDDRNQLFGLVSNIFTSSLSFMKRIMYNIAIGTLWFVKSLILKPIDLGQE